jgi:SAM-dependent methyltransferase
MARYLFDHGWELELHRLRLLEEVFDPGTTRYFEALGVGRGWRCLEIGAGAGSIVRWLCGRVGEGGRVMATDVDTGFLVSLSEPNLEVSRHDVVADDLPDGGFDLIHARLVLEHLPERDVALKRLVTALAPGGVLMLEEFDWSSLVCAPGPWTEVVDRVIAAAREFMESCGYLATFGRHLVGAFRSHGLGDIGAEGRVVVGLPGSAATEWWRLNIERLSDAIMARGGISAGDIDEVLAALDREEFSFLYPILVAAWGRRPPSDGG